MPQILTSERNSAQPMATKKLLVTGLALVSVFFVFTTIPLILDQQYWFLEYPKGMNYSFSNIHEYVWGEGRDINGRFSVIKLYVVYAYTLFGLRIAPELHISIHTYRAIVDILLFISLFASLNFFLKGLRLRINSEHKYLSGAFIRQITLVTALVFGTFANLRWAHNGLIAYTILTYTPVILSLILSGVVMRLLRRELESGSSARAWIKLLALALVISLWSNWYYELSTATIVTITGAVIFEYLQHDRRAAFQTSLKHAFTYGLAFLAIFIPTRIWSAQECANTDCYEGLKLSPSTMPLTFVQNILNPLPIIGPRHDVVSSAFHNWLSPLGFAAFIAIGLLAAYTLMLNIRPDGAAGSESFTYKKSSLLLKISALPLIAGITAALIMSLSERASRLVQMGHPYRHTTALWLAYSLTIAIALVLYFPAKAWLQKALGAILVLSAVLTTTTHYFNVDLLWHERTARMTRELYPLLLDEQYPSVGQELNCALENGMLLNEFESNKFIPLADAYSQWHQHRAFCSK